MKRSESRWRKGNSRPGRW